MEVRPHLKGPHKRYVLREPHSLYPNVWHVTARFQVQIKTRVYIQVVRLRHGIGPVRHFTIDELDRVFKPEASS